MVAVITLGKHEGKVKSSQLYYGSMRFPVKKPFYFTANITWHERIQPGLSPFWVSFPGWEISEDWKYSPTAHSVS